MDPVAHVLGRLGEEVDGLLLLGGRVEGNDGEAAVEVVLLWNATEHDLRDFNDLWKERGKQEGEREGGRETEKREEGRGTNMPS